MAFLLRLSSDDGRFSIVIEDDDRVVHAYLLQETGIVADVWLYNRVPAPADPEWGGGTRGPYLNSREFVNSPDGLEIAEDAFKLRYTSADSGELRACIYAGEDLLGVLSPGARPGWAGLAAKKGPVALPLGEYSGPLP